MLNLQIDMNYWDYPLSLSVYGFIDKIWRRKVHGEFSVVFKMKQSSRAVVESSFLSQLVRKGEHDRNSHWYVRLSDCLAHARLELLPSAFQIIKTDARPCGDMPWLVGSKCQKATWLAAVFPVKKTTNDIIWRPWKTSFLQTTCSWWD